MCAKTVVFYWVTIAVARVQGFAFLFNTQHWWPINYMQTAWHIKLGRKEPLITLTNSRNTVWNAHTATGWSTNLVLIGRATSNSYRWIWKQLLAWRYVCTVLGNFCCVHTVTVWQHWQSSIPRQNVFCVTAAWLLQLIPDGKETVRVQYQGGRDQIQ